MLVWLAITRPGNLAGETAVGYRLLTSLVAVAAVGYIVWRFHGILPAAAAVILLRACDPDQPPTAAFLERGSDAVLLATLAIGIAAGARRASAAPAPGCSWPSPRPSSPFFGWYGRELPDPRRYVARARLWHLTAAVTMLAVPIGLSGP